MKGYIFFSSKSSFICLKLKNIAVLNLSCSNSCIQHIYPFQDHNRYNAGRGAHINLKRAEKARVLVSKIPCKLYTYLHVYLSLNCHAPLYYIICTLYQKAVVPLHYYHFRLCGQQVKQIRDYSPWSKDFIIESYACLGDWKNQLTESVNLILILHFKSLLVDLLSICRLPTVLTKRKIQFSHVISFGNMWYMLLHIFFYLSQIYSIIW